MLETLARIAIYVLLPLLTVGALVGTFVWAINSPYAGGFAFLVTGAVAFFGGASLISWLNGY